MIKRKTNYTRSFLLGCATAALFILPWIIKDGYFYLGYDYVEQQIPFISRCLTSLREGSLWWDEAYDLGTGYIGAYCYYGLGSPLFWLFSWINPETFYLVNPFLLILRFGLCSAAGYAWVRRQCDTEHYAVLGGLLYAFSGYQISNMNFQFIDSLIFFPLLLIALDETVINKRRGFFAITAAVCASTNFLFFVSEVIFLVIYFAIMVYRREYKINLRMFGRLAFESAAGTALTAILLLPAIMFMLSNPRVDNGFNSISRALFYRPIYLVDFLRGLLLPAECIFKRAFFTPLWANSPELYLPVFGLIPAVSWLFKNKHSIAAKIVITCAILAAVPFLNSLFVLGNAEYYTRWFFMPVLFLCLATVKALEDKSLSFKPGFIFYGVVLLLFGIAAIIWKPVFDATFIIRDFLSIVFFAISFAGLGICLYLRRIQKLRYAPALLTALVMLFGAGTAFINTHYSHKYWEEDREIAPVSLWKSQLDIVPANRSRNWRVETRASFDNLGLMLNLPTVSNFSSTVSGSIFNFSNALDIERTVYSIIPPENFALRNFLSVKYQVSHHYRPHITPTMNRLDDKNGYMIFENPNFVPMGFTFEEYIPEEQFLKLKDSEEKSAALLKGLVLNDEQIRKYGTMLKPVDHRELKKLSDEAVLSDSRRRRESSCSDFVTTNRGYNATISLKRDNLVFFSIPYSSGWEAFVNGKPADVECVDFGMIAVPADKGENRIELVFTPPGFTVGVVLSLSSALALAGYAFIPHIKKRISKG